MVSRGQGIGLSFRSLQNQQQDKRQSAVAMAFLFVNIGMKTGDYRRRQDPFEGAQTYEL